MTPAEHYARAERCLWLAEMTLAPPVQDAVGRLDASATAVHLVARAHVHAALAAVPRSVVDAAEAVIEDPCPRCGKPLFVVTETGGALGCDCLPECEEQG